MQLVLRADANDAIGAGHVMRCATLAQAWRTAGFGPVLLAGRVDIPFVNARLQALDVRVVAADVSTGEGADRILVVDTYDIAARRAAAGFPARCRALVDDLGGDVPEGYAVVWHPHPDGDGRRFGGFRGSIITGASAVPIREDLPIWTGETGAADVGVTLGGGAAPASLVSALVRIADDGRFRFIGSGNWVPAGWERIENDRMWSRFARTSRLLTGAGSTVWEAAVVGIPTSIVQIAPNQALVAEWAARTSPVLRFDASISEPVIGAAVVDALDRSAPLTRLHDGAPAVARTLFEAAHGA